DAGRGRDSEPSLICQSPHVNRSSCRDGWGLWMGLWFLRSGEFSSCDIEPPASGRPGRGDLEQLRVLGAAMVVSQRAPRREQAASGGNAGLTRPRTVTRDLYPGARAQGAAEVVGVRRRRHQELGIGM